MRSKTEDMVSVDTDFIRNKLKEQKICQEDLSKALQLNRSSISSMLSQGRMNKKYVKILAASAKFNYEDAIRKENPSAYIKNTNKEDEMLEKLNDVLECQKHINNILLEIYQKMREAT